MFQMYGVVPPMITPFQENGEVDYDSLKTLVSFLSENVDGLFITGSYGGGALMTEEERRGVAETTINTTSGRLRGNSGQPQRQPAGGSCRSLRCGRGGCGGTLLL